MRQRTQEQHPSTTMRQLRRRIYDINREIESMRADWSRIFERSDGEDPSLDTRYAAICKAEDEVKRLRWQLRTIDRLISVETPTPAA